MANMSYCRFQNTLEDLKDCFDNLDDNLNKRRNEARARIRLVELCERMVSQADLDEFTMEYDEAKQLDS